MKSIEVSIGGRGYPVKVTEDEEAVVLQIADEINRRISDLQTTYRGKDKQDYLSMALLSYALEQAQNSASSEEMDIVKSKTEAIFSALEAIG